MHKTLKSATVTCFFASKSNLLGFLHRSEKCNMLVSLLPEFHYVCFNMPIVSRIDACQMFFLLLISDAKYRRKSQTTYIQRTLSEKINVAGNRKTTRIIVQQFIILHELLQLMIFRFSLRIMNYCTLVIRVVHISVSPLPFISFLAVYTYIHVVYTMYVHSENVELASSQ